MQKIIAAIGAAAMLVSAQGLAFAQEPAAAPPQAPAALVAPTEATPVPTPEAATPVTAETPSAVEAAAAVEAPAATATPGAPPLVAHAVRRAAPDFLMMKAGNAAFGLLGMPAMIASSKKLVAEFRIEDPVDALAADLAGQLAAAKGGAVASAPILVNETAKNPVAGNVEKARYVLDLGQSHIIVVYFPTDWTHYTLSYSVAGTVTDTTTGKVVAKGKCVVKPAKKSDDSPTDAELFENDAARLKAMIKAASDACAPQLQAMAKI